MVVQSASQSISIIWPIIVPIVVIPLLPPWFLPLLKDLFLGVKFY